MMLATPVRSSAWSSTSSTVAFRVMTTASAGNVHLRRKVRWLPGEHDFGSAARRRDDRQRGADALRTFLHARHAEAAGCMTVRDPPTIVCNRQPDTNRSDGGRTERNPLRPRMPDGVAQRLLRDADDLALDQVAKTWKFVHLDVDGNLGRPLGHAGKALERGGDFL